MSLITELERDPFTPPSETMVRTWIVQMLGGIERLLEGLDVQSYTASYDENLALAGSLYEALRALGFDINTLPRIGVPVDLNGIIGLSKSRPAKKD